MPVARWIRVGVFAVACHALAAPVAFPAAGVGTAIAAASAVSVAATAAPAASTAGGAEALGARIDSIFAPYARKDCPGCAVGISVGGRTLFERGYGMADLEQAVPITPETIFEAGSVSKQFVAAALVLLAQEGRLSLDDTVRRWLPELPDLGHPFTIRQLLGHTSGLRDHWTLLDLQGRPTGEVVHTLPEVVALARAQRRLNFEPGSQYLYSNLGYVLAGLIVQRVSGDSLPTFTRKRLFEPLGLRHSAWREDFRTIVPGRAQAYSPAPTGGFRLDMPFSRVYGSGGMLTTVGDLLRWNEALTGDRVGRPGLAALLATPARLRDGRSTHYGFGLGVAERDGLAEIRHGGATAGYRAYLTRFPRERLSIALLCNRGDANTDSLARRVAEATLALRGGWRGLGPTPRRVSLEVLRRWTGLYRDRESGEVQRVALRDSTLRLGWGRGVGLLALGERRFRTAGWPFTEVWFRRLGSRRGMSVGEDEHYAFAGAEEAAPSAARLREAAGKYRSAELGVVYTLALHADTLLLERPVLQEERLVPLDADAYRAAQSGDQVRLTRGAGRAVDGLEVFSGRVLHLRFDREDRGNRTPER